MTRRDGRSVGEILLEADHSARELLMDAPDLDAAVVLRTWGEVVQTAAELWAVLPGPPAEAHPMWDQALDGLLRPRRRHGRAAWAAHREPPPGAL